MSTRHDSPATVKGSKHVCKTAGCIKNNYKAKPTKRRPYLGSSVPKGNVRVAEKDGAMKLRRRSERQDRRVALQEWNKERNKDYYQTTGSSAAWKSGR